MVAQRPVISAEVSTLLDHDIRSIRDEILSQDPDGSRFAKAIRRTYDMLLDGVNTGRYKWEQLHKTEKTHCGTVVEINLQREFKFPDGDVLDYKVQGIEVDCKYSQEDGKWMIPPEAFGHVLLGVWANDQLGIFRAGLVRATPSLLTDKGNRDHKRTLSAVGRSSVVPLFANIAIPDNILLRLTHEDEQAIFSHRSGQRRVSELFRRVQGRQVSRTAIATVAQQHDYMKRVRDNGGARTILKAEGIVILGQYEVHREIAIRLGIAVPGRGDFVSVRLARRTPEHGDLPHVGIAGLDWVVALAGDPVTTAPLLPSPTSRGEEFG